MIPLHKGGGRCRTGGKRSSAPNAICKKNTPCTFTGWRVERNVNLITKKKILKMWRAGGKSNPSVRNIHGLNANMCFDFLDCPIAAAATESPSCPCVKHTLSLADRVCVKQIKSKQKS